MLGLFVAIFISAGLGHDSHSDIILNPINPWETVSFQPCTA